MINKRRSKILILLAIFVVSLSVLFINFDYASAQGQTVINGLEDVGNEVNLSAQDPRIIIANVIRILLGFLGIVGLAVILYGGFMYMTSGGAEQAVEKAKKLILNGIIGMVIILSAFALTSFIIGALVDATGGGNFGNDNTNITTTNPPPGSGYTVSVSPTGTDKPITSIVQIQFPYGHLPHSVENAVNNITVIKSGGADINEYTCPEITWIASGQTGYMGGFTDDACNVVPGCHWSGALSTGECVSDQNDQVGGPATGCPNYDTRLNNLYNEYQDSARMASCAAPCKFEDNTYRPDFCTVPGVEADEEVEGQFALDGRKIIFTPDSDCPDSCGSEKCFPADETYRIQISRLMDTDNDIINCGGTGFCQEVEFSTSNSCDVDGPVVNISNISPDPMVTGSLFDLYYSATDTGGIYSVEMCPVHASGYSEYCQETFPFGNPVAVSDLFNSIPNEPFDLGWHYARITAEDLTGQSSTILEKYLIASAACFDDSGVFDCNLDGCEVPCDECPDGEQCSYYCEETLCVNECPENYFNEDSLLCDSTLDTNLCYAQSAIRVFNFNDGSGGVAADEIGDHSATINGAEWTTEGKFGSALSFNGTSDYISISNSTDINTATHTERSVGLWFKANDTSKKQVLYEEGGATRGLNIYILDNKLYAGGWNEPASESDWEGSWINTSLADNDWHYVVVTLNSKVVLRNGAVSMYLDGELIGSDQGSQLWPHSGNINIGRSGDTKFHTGNDGIIDYYFEGIIDQVSIYNRALLASEVKSINGCSEGTSPDKCDFKVVNNCLDIEKVPNCSTECKTWPFPVIDAVLPESGPKDSFVTLVGRNFGSFGEQSKVTFNGVEAPLACGGGASSWNNNQVIVQVPDTSTGAVRLYDQDGYYNDTGDTTAPGWKGDFTFETGDSDWVGLCSVENKDGEGAVGEPGEYAKALGENIGDLGSVYFNGTLVTHSVWGTDGVVDNIKIPNLATGKSQVQLGRDDTISNPVDFRILARQNNLTIESVTPENGAQKQFITIKGSNFGQSGSVSFVSGTDAVLAEQQCDGGWNDNEIIVNVPEDITKDTYSLQVTGVDGTDSVDFIVNDDLLTPGICSLNPNNGPAGTKLKFSGIGFGDDYSAIQFAGMNGTTETVQSGTLTLDEVEWDDERIFGVKVPPTAASGDVFVKIGEVLSNPAHFNFGKCTDDSSCGTGEVCCESTYCSLANECEVEYTETEYGWYFSTGSIPQVPKVIERECIQGVYHESTSPSRNEQNACPNGQLSVTFNMNMEVSSFLTNKINIKRCTTPGQQCNFDNCSDPDAGCSETLYNLIATATGGDATYHEVQTSNYMSHEVTQLILDFDYAGAGSNLGADFWYQITVPSGVNAKNDDLETVELLSDHTWTFHTGIEDCSLESVLVNPADGVIEEVFETQKYVATGQAANCAILDVSGESWSWSLDKYKDRLVRDTVVSNDEATYKIISGVTNPETAVGDPAVVTASALIDGTTMTDDANLSVLFKDPRVISYWPNCGEACGNAEIGMRFNTYMKKDAIVNNPNLVKLYKCHDEECSSLTALGDDNVNLILNTDDPAQITCDSTDGTVSLNIGGTNVDVCNRIKILPHTTTTLLPSSYYRPVLISDVQSVSNKTLSGLNFSSTYEQLNVCGNALLEPNEQCEAFCRDDNGAECTPNTTGCNCSLANNQYCDNDCQFKNIPLCDSTITTSCCGNGLIENYSDVGVEFDQNDFLLKEEFYTSESLTNNGWVVIGDVTIDKDLILTRSGRITKELGTALNSDDHNLTFYVSFDPTETLEDARDYTIYESGPNSTNKFSLIKNGKNTYGTSNQLYYQLGSSGVGVVIPSADYQESWKEDKSNLLILTTDGTTAEVYLNGNLVKSKDITMTTLTGIQTLSLGGSYDNGFMYDGDIQSFGILKKYFTEDQISIISRQELVTEQCEATCKKVQETQFIGNDPLTACTDYLATLSDDDKISQSCDCSYGDTCETENKVCAKYCKEDIAQECVGSSPGCTCIEASIQSEAFTADGSVDYCTDNEAGCTCLVDKRCRDREGTVGDVCVATTDCAEGSQCEEVGSFQFSPDIQCFNDNLTDKALGECVKLSHCSEDATVCTENVASYNCVALSSLEGALCPADDLVCQESCDIKEKVSCAFGADDCVCSLPTGCKSCLYPNVVTRGIATSFDAFSWVFKVKEGEALCQPDNIKVTPATYISVLADEKVGYSATPYSEPDTCSLDGQALNANSFDWDWASVPDNRSFTSTNIKPLPTAKRKDYLIDIFTFTYATSPAVGCSGSCINEGSSPYGSICGNGIIEIGEECDTSNSPTDESCTDDCLNAGTFTCFGENVNDATAICCGNGVVNTGEECDGGVGCSESCLNLGSGDSGFKCGNRIKELGEDADVGSNNEKYGIDSSSCLFVGSTFPITEDNTVYSDAVCGNGTVDSGEECEPLLKNCKKITPSGIAFDSCNPNDSSDDLCVCEEYEDDYCDVDCTLKSFPVCGNVSKCTESPNAICTQDVNVCTCDIAVGEIEGHCTEDVNVACVVSADKCTCESQTTATNCCGNGIIDTYTYTEGTQKASVTEECETFSDDNTKNCFLQVSCKLSDARAYWSFDEGTGTTVKTSPNLYTAELESDSRWVAGNKDYGLSFAGNSDDAINIGDNLDIGTGNFSLSVWVKNQFPNDGDGDNTIISKRTGIADDNKLGDYHIYFQNNKLVFKMHTIRDSDGEVVENTFESNGNFAINTFSHIVLTLDRDNITLYVDNVLDKTQVLIINDSINLRNESDFIIGAKKDDRGDNDDYSKVFNGVIDELAVFNKALTSSEVSNLYNECTTMSNQLACNLGDPGCVCQMPEWCNNCLNSGSSSSYSEESFCSDGIKGLGEDAECETDLTGTTFTSPFAVATVLGYLPTAQKSEKLQIRAEITSDENATSYTGVFGEGDFEYVYDGYGGPAPEGCGIDDYPEATLTSPALDDAVCRNSAIQITFDQIVRSAHYAIDGKTALTQNQLNDIIRLEFMTVEDNCDFELTQDGGIIKRAVNSFVLGVKKAVGFFTGRSVSAVGWCPVYDKIITTSQVEEQTVIDVSLNGNAFNTATYRVVVEDLKDACDDDMPPQEFSFSVGPDFCRINEVAVSPASKFVSQANEEWNILHYAMYNSTVLQQVDGIYTWQWHDGNNVDWTVGDSSVLSLNLGTADADEDFAQSNKISGLTTVSAEVTVTLDTTGSSLPGLTDGASAIGSGTVDVFICDNPWNGEIGADGWPLSTTISTSVKNIKLRYCRDSGNTDDESDDLPELKPVSAPTDVLDYDDLSTYVSDECKNGVDDDGDGDMDFDYNPVSGSVTMEYDKCLYNGDLGAQFADETTGYSSEDGQYVFWKSVNDGSDDDIDFTFKLGTYTNNTVKFFAEAGSCPGANCDFYRDIGYDEYFDIFGEYYKLKSVDETSHQVTFEVVDECYANPAGDVTATTSMNIFDVAEDVVVSHPKDDPSDSFTSREISFVVNGQAHELEDGTTPGTYIGGVNPNTNFKLDVTDIIIGTSDIQVNFTVSNENPDSDCVTETSLEQSTIDACSDGLDNDYDGKIDGYDPECAGGYGFESKATMLSQYYFLRESTDTTSDGSGDAIALRVYTNPELQSAGDWYRRNVPNIASQNPAEISLGCYTDAYYKQEICYYGVKDGNTIYLSAGNVEGTNLNNYIYVLAYGLGSNSVTVDIFSQMLAHIEFNTNVTNSDKKWAIKRDIKRLNDIVAIKNLLVGYFQNNGSLPKISGGTYIRNVAVSSWPSWQSEFGSILGANVPKDPVNFYEQYNPLPSTFYTDSVPPTNSGTVCGTGLYCRDINHQCIESSGRCSVCTKGSDPSTCYNSDTLTFGMGGPAEIYSTASSLYQYQYIAFNAGQLFYGLEGVSGNGYGNNYYTVPGKPSSSIYFDVQ